jgi:hypothetical protein
VSNQTLQIKQSFINTTRFIEAQSIRFIENSFGFKPEFTPPANFTNNLVSTDTGGNSNPSENILTDFEPSFSASNQAGYQQQLVYIPTFYRFADIISSSSKNLNIIVEWISQQGAHHQLMLGPGRSATIKLAFVRKNCVYDYYNKK